MSVLAVFGSLFSGVVGALMVFWLGTRKDKQNAEEQRDEERKALWRLVDMEIYQNRYKLLRIRDSPDIGQLYDSYSQLHIETWRENKGRLAQLLSTEQIEGLVKYYGLIQRLGVSLHDEAFKPPNDLTRREKRNKGVQRAIEQGTVNAVPKKNTLLSVYARDALRFGDEVRQLGKRYIGGEVPDYFKLYEENGSKDVGITTD